jgi:TolA protein
MREARAGSEAIRGAVEERRSEAAARAAVRSVGERVAHRIEAPPPARSGARGAAGGGGGAQGSVRLSPELSDYFRRLEESVRNSWVLPGALVRDAGKLVVELRIVIEKDGRVSAQRIERGSGNSYFDDSVLRAIRKASPLPVPPEQLRGGEDHYEIGFRFHGGAR